MVYSSLPSMPPPHAASQDHANNRIRSIDLATRETTSLPERFNRPRGVAIDPSGTFALVAVRRGPPYTYKHTSHRRHPPHLYPTPTPRTYTAPRGRCAAQHMACRPQFPVALVPAR